MESLVRTVFALCLAVPAAVAGPARAQEWTKEDKAFYLNLGAGALALGWGTWSWDWGSGGPRFQDEGWFGRATGEGGADKLGHAWSGYALSHLFANRYEAWGYSQSEAARFGAASSLGIMGLVEVGDAFSDDYGFSYQDMLFNAAGAVAGYVLWDNPDLARKVDFRVEYNPFTAGTHESDVFTDYKRLKYILAIKADGFDGIENPLLRNLELHIGYYTRGYETDTVALRARDERRRHLYVGIGLNLTRLLSPHADVGGVLHYIQPPYTYVAYDRNLDD